MGTHGYGTLENGMGRAPEYERWSQEDVRAIQPRPETSRIWLRTGTDRRANKDTRTYWTQDSERDAASDSQTRPMFHG